MSGGRVPVQVDRELYRLAARAAKKHPQYRGVVANVVRDGLRAELVRVGYMPPGATLKEANEMRVENTV